MPWFNKKRNNPFWYTAAVVVGMVLLALLYTSLLHATDTQIGAKVCGSNPDAAIIEITQPTDDSIVNQSTVTVRGNVASAAQIIVEVDGVYNGTVAIPAEQTTFMSDVALSEGTHTITLRATEICGGSDGVDEVVVTYQPAVEPSTGGQTPTAVEDGDEPIGGVSVVQGQSQDDVEAPKESAVDRIPVIGTVVNAVGDMASAIGLQETFAAGGATTASGAARVGLTVAAMTSVVMAGTLAPLAVQAVPGVARVFDATSHRSMLYLGWVIRGAGVLTMALTYFI